MKIFDRFNKQHHVSAILIALCVLIIGIIYFAVPGQSPFPEEKTVEYDLELLDLGVQVPQVEIDDRVKFEVFIADEPHEQTRGLSGRDRLEEYQGMLFFMNEIKHHTFWMKDMKFDIDIIWIKDHYVVDVDRNVSSAPHRQLDLQTPLEPANIVLEVNAGLAERYGIDVGDYIEYHNIFFERDGIISTESEY
jgi:uncharacterized membrane protein (UPF0127 family)